MPVVSDAQIAFLSLLVLGGHIGMLLILSTVFLSRHIKRHAVFINFCITWMLYTLAYTLLLYVGQVSNPSPEFRLCVTQSAMIYGSPAMVGVSLFAFVLHLYDVLVECVHGDNSRWPRLRLIVMLAVPYIVFIIVFIVAFTLANAHPQHVHRSTLYCTINSSTITHLSAGISGIAIICSLVVETLTAITLHRHWQAFRALGSRTGLTLSVLVRTLVVLICSVIALLTCLAFIAKSTSMLPNIVLACLPLLTFLVFGTRSDLLRAWCFWRKDNKLKGTESTSSLTEVVE